MPKRCVRWSVVLLSLGLMGAGCGSADVLDELVTNPTSTLTPNPTSTLSPTSTSTLTPTSTSTPTTSTPTSTSAGGTVAAPEISPSAVVLAELHRISADLVEDQFAANTDPDPIGAAIGIWQSANQRVLALTPTDTTADVVAGWAQVTEEYIALFEEYGPRLVDPDQAEAALAGFLAENTALIEENTSLDEEVARLTIAELGGRGDPLGSYLADVSIERGGATEAVVELFGAIELAGSDPVAALRAMEGPVAEIVRIGERIASITPPPAAADIHDRQVALLEDYGTAFSALLESLDAGDASPPTAVLLTLQRVGTEAPALNAEFTRFLADALAGDVI